MGGNRKNIRAQHTITKNKKWKKEIVRFIEELLRENAYLRDENKRLHQDNEQLRSIFRIATVEFEKKNREKESSNAELEKAYSTIKMLAEENAELKTRLEAEQSSTD